MSWGGTAEQDRQRILELLQRLFDHRNACLGVEEQRFSLLKIERADFAGFELRVGDPHAFVLILEIFIRDIELLLGGSDEQVGLGNLGDQRQHDTIVAGNAGVKCCRCRFDLTFKAAPDVRLPSQVEAQIVNGKIVLQ